MSRLLFILIINYLCIIQLGCSRSICDTPSKGMVASTG